MGIKDWILDLLSLNEDVWMTYAFEREPFKGKVSFDEYKEFYNKAESEGKQKAKDEILLGCTDVFALKEKLAVKVENFTLEQVGGLGAFALFIEPNTIQILKDNADKTTELLRMESENPLLSSLDVYSVVLLHELFHVIQFNDKEMFVNKKHIVLNKFFGIERKARLSSLEEVAAFSFVKEFMNLSFNPEILNPVMLYHNNKKEAEKLYNKLMEFKKGNLYEI